MEKEYMVSDILKWIPGKSHRNNTYLWLPAWLHMADTCEIMEYLFYEWLPDSVKKAILDVPDEEVLLKLCRFIACVHDIGKLTPVFVAKIVFNLPDIKDRLNGLGFDIVSYNVFKHANETPHALVGGVILQILGCSEDVASVVSSHHGKPPELDDDNAEAHLKTYSLNYYGKNGAKSESAQLWKKSRTEWFEIALKLSGFSTVEDIPIIDLPAQMLLTGLLIMADWIASNEKYFPLISVDETGEDLNIKMRAKEAWEILKLPSYWESEFNNMDYQDFEDRFGFYPNAVQQSMIDISSNCIKPGILILEAQMGVGKTEAALAAAEIFAAKRQCGGVYFGLPTQATANGIFSRLEGWAEQQTEDIQLAIRLAHGMAALNEEYRSLFQGKSVLEEDGEDRSLIVHPWFEGSKQALLANFVIGTVDQLLMVALKQKHLMLRHLGIAGKVIVVDECHAYDAYMNQYLDRAINWLGKYGCPVIILSATLPAKRRGELIDAYLNRKKPKVEEAWRQSRDYPLVTWTDGKDVHSQSIEISSSRKTIQMAVLNDNAVAQCLKEHLSEGGCAGIIVNTVKRAQDFADYLSKELPDYKIILFHAHFLATDRSDREQMLQKLLGKKSSQEQRNGVIVVGTQVLEQSLDLDFDFMITDLCPMDLLLQRIGRLQRHAFRDELRPDKLKTATCMVLGMQTDEFESGAKAVYGEWLLHRTKRIIPSKIILPDMIAELVQTTYKDPEALETLDTLENAMWNKYDSGIKEKIINAKTYCIKQPGKRDILTGLLDTKVGEGEQVAMATVRDGEPSLSVIVMVKYAEDEIGFLPWQNQGKRYKVYNMPGEHDCMQIAKQQIKLPAVFSKSYCIDAVIAVLEEDTKVHIGNWWQSRWLNGELFLLLEKDFTTVLNGYTIKYDKEIGLTYEKETDDERTGDTV